MIIENEFTVGADQERVWRELLDMEGVASCLPGATITATDQENVYHGSMRLKIGPMRVEYRGTATLSEVDEQNHTAVISLSAREAKGQGFARATIRNRLTPSESGGTRVTAQTELQITGPQAQFGRGVIEDVGKRVLGEFAKHLEQRISGQADGTGAAAGGEEDAAGGPSGTPEEAAGLAPGGMTTGAGVGATGPGVVTSEGPGASEGPGLVASERVTPGTSGAYSGAATPGGAAELVPAASTAPVADELDVGSLVWNSPPARRAAAITVGLLVLLMILLRRRRRPAPPL